MLNLNLSNTMSSLDKDPKNLAELLKKLTKDKKWDDRVIVSEIRKHWSEITSENMANSVYVYDLKAGTLKLKVKNPVWRTEIHLRKEQIVEKINEYFDRKVVESIVLV